MKIVSKKFESEESLSDFIEETKVVVISIETVRETVRTNLPMPNGTDFKYEKDFYKLWYRIG